jgi:hypothetical protein
MKTTILALLLAGMAFSQTNGAPSQVPAEDNPNLPRYWAIGTGTSVTLQAKSTSDPAFLETGNIYCAAASVVTFSFNGTAASTGSTALKTFGFANSSAPPTFWVDSNVGSGTAGQVFNIAAGQTLVLRLAPLALSQNGGTANNITMTGTTSCTYQFLFRTKYQ